MKVFLACFVFCKTDISYKGEEAAENEDGGGGGGDSD